MEQNAQRGVTVRYTPQHQAARAAEQTAAIPEYLHAGKGRLQGEKTGKIDPRQDSVQRLVDIEQKMAEGKGKGYPTGKSGEDIPLIARIICVSDAFDAMNSQRCYRSSLSPEVILSELENNKGSQFDPVIVEHLQALIDDGKVNLSGNN